MYIKFKQATISIKIGNAYIDANTKEKQVKVNTEIKVGVITEGEKDVIEGGHIDKFYFFTNVVTHGLF